MSSVPPAESVAPTKIPLWRQVVDQGVVTPELVNYQWPGAGTPQDPFVVSWIDGDPRNPMLWSSLKKWGLTCLVGIATFAMALISSAYSGGVIQIEQTFHASEEVVTLGLSLFVLGFAVGPLLWAPFSEMLGRQYVFFISYMGLAALNAGCAGSRNIWTLIILRFLAGSWGSSPLTNAGGIIADMFPSSHRGLAIGVFALMPFLGPSIGPIIGGFLAMTKGWRWVEGLLAIFSGAVWIVTAFLLPETYAPVLLRRRAERLSKLTGKVYVSRLDAERGRSSFGTVLLVSLSRPWKLLLREPIVLLLSIYMAIIYGTLYMLFDAFPIVFQEVRGWNQGVGGLSFIGVMVGMLLAMPCIVFDNHRYAKASARYGGFAPPELRLVACMFAAIALPIGLFWFAWTNFPSIHWIVCIIAAAPFGWGMVLAFVGIMNYLVDAYTIYAASVLAANSVLRSVFGAVFPLFTTYMFRNLGIHWASSIPAFLALVCVPMPFAFYHFGHAIRMRCKYAAEAAEFTRQLQARANTDANAEIAAEEEKERAREDAEEKQVEAHVDAAAVAGDQRGPAPAADYDASEYEQPPPPAEEAADDVEKGAPLRQTLTSSTIRSSRSHRSYQMAKDPHAAGALRRTRSHLSAAERLRDEYESSPFDLDLVHTHTRDGRKDKGMPE